MSEEILNKWQHGEQHDFSLLQEILDKTVIYDAVVARHNHLVSLVPKVITPDTEAEIRLTMAEVDKNMQHLLKLMEELEQLCARAPFFQREEEK